MSCTNEDHSELQINENPTEQSADLDRVAKQELIINSPVQFHMMAEADAEVLEDRSAKHAHLPSELKTDNRAPLIESIISPTTD